MLSNVFTVEWSINKSKWPRVEYNAKQRIYRYINKRMAKGRV